jgi:hypothetical protein
LAESISVIRNKHSFDAGAGITASSTPAALNVYDAPFVALGRTSDPILSFGTVEMIDTGVDVNEAIV